MQPGQWRGIRTLGAMGGRQVLSSQSAGRMQLTPTGSGPPQQPTLLGCSSALRSEACSQLPWFSGKIWVQTAKLRQLWAGGQGGGLLPDVLWPMAQAQTLEGVHSCTCVWLYLKAPLCM